MEQWAHFEFIGDGGEFHGCRLAGFMKVVVPQAADDESARWFA